MLLRRTSEMFIYYTDSHDVDEDKRTILRHGEHWPGSTFTGIVMRFLFDNPSQITSDVASSNMKNSAIIRIIIMSTKI